MKTEIHLPRNDESRGCLFVFEGIDGTGKSTQLALLADSLHRNGYDTVVTREPTDSTYGQKIRKLYKNRNSVTREEELQLFIDDRKEHVATFIKPNLQKGKIILCDRYFLSTIAYQGALGMDIREIEKRNNFAPQPDLAFLFQVPPRISIHRITKHRQETPNDFEQERFLEKVDAIFRSLDYPFIRCVDAQNSITAVHNFIWKLTHSWLEKHRRA